MIQDGGHLRVSALQERQQFRHRCTYKADMNKTDNTKQVRHGILLLKCLHLLKPAQQRLN